MGIGPVFAVPKLLAQHGLRVADIGLWELNEAFAVQALYCRDKLGIDPELYNVNGGGISIGHPYGMSGARLVGHALIEGKRRGVEARRRHHVRRRRHGCRRALRSALTMSFAACCHAVTSTSCCFEWLGVARLTARVRVCRPFPRDLRGGARHLLGDRGRRVRASQQEGRPRAAADWSARTSSPPGAARRSSGASPRQDCSRPARKRVSVACSLPYVIERAGLAFVLAACPATSAYAFLTMANANLLLAYGTPSQIERFVRPMLDGPMDGHDVPV